MVWRHHRLTTGVLECFERPRDCKRYQTTHSALDQIDCVYSSTCSSGSTIRELPCLQHYTSYKGKHLNSYFRPIYTTSDRDICPANSPSGTKASVEVHRTRSIRLSWICIGQHRWLLQHLCQIYAASTGHRRSSPLYMGTIGAVLGSLSLSFSWT